jgi:hypothetical protein
LRRALAALPLALLNACAPVLTHGPRVEPGLYLGYTAGLTVAGDSLETPDVVTPEWLPYARYGFRGRPGGLAGSLALSPVPDVETTVQGDAYLQLPSRDPRWAYGAGVMGSRRFVMPYLQLGRRFSRGNEVYTTQAWVRRKDFMDTDIFDESDTGEARPRYWAPTLALRRRDGATGLSLQVTGAFGRYDHRTYDSASAGPVTRSRPVRAVTTSVTADVDAARFIRDVLSVTRRPIPRDDPPR